MFATTQLVPITLHIFSIFGPCTLANKCNRCQLIILKTKPRKNTICYHMLVFRRLNVREKLYRTRSVLIWVPSRSDDRSEVIQTRNLKLSWLVPGDLHCLQWCCIHLLRIGLLFLNGHPSIEVPTSREAVGVGGREGGGDLHLPLRN